MGAITKVITPAITEAIAAARSRSTPRARAWASGRNRRWVPAGPPVPGRLRWPGSITSAIEDQVWSACGWRRPWVAKPLPVSPNVVGPCKDAGHASGSEDDAAMSRRPWWRNRFAYAVIASAALVGTLYLYRIGSDPPGLYADEASIGYNAWTIAHYGTDQYGNHFPLFFVAFGDY